MPTPDDDELDLILSNVDAGLRLLSYLHERTEPDDRETVAPDQALLLEVLIAQSAHARSAYDRARSQAGER